MRLLFVATLLLLAACAEPPRIGITISNTPAPIGACAPPKPGAGCPWRKGGKAVTPRRWTRNGGEQLSGADLAWRAQRRLDRVRDRRLDRAADRAKPARATLRRLGLEYRQTSSTRARCAGAFARRWSRVRSGASSASARAMYTASYAERLSRKS